jgi:hypothetical protein
MRFPLGDLGESALSAGLGGGGGTSAIEEPSAARMGISSPDSDPALGDIGAGTEGRADLIRMTHISAE